jgi:eukaryotic-like serine/threonine-protein kinase
VRWLSDTVVDHLCRVADWPDLTGTKYEVIGKIGQGGMAAVYRARDRDLDREVALKVLFATDANAGASVRMEQEARIIARLEHPGIVPVHDAGILPDGRVYYTMKLVQGKRLDGYADAGSSIAGVLHIFEKICQAVAFAHAHGVIHRDLKPENIMVGPFGEVLVMDWGVAKLLHNPAPRGDAVQLPEDMPSPEQDGTANGTIVGTPGYMAPEQSQGLVDLANPRTDVFGLGAILHFLLTGRPPCPAPTRDRADAPVRTIAGSPNSARAIPRPLQAVCQKAMAPRPEQRYESAQELAADIGRFLAGDRVMAYREPWFEAAARLLSKHRVAVLLVLAYLLMRILLLFFGRT